MKLKDLIEEYGEYEVKDNYMDMLIEPKQWTPRENEQYYFITVGGSVCQKKWKVQEDDYFRLGKRNVYKTIEEANKALKMYHFCKKRSFEPNWEGENKGIFYISINSKNCDVYRCVSTTRLFEPFYYPTIGACEEVLDEYSYEELVEYYGRV